MRSSLKSFALALCASAVFPVLSSAQHYVQKNLVSSITQPANSDGSTALLDRNLRNPWGLTRSSSSPWWVNLNATGNSAIYTGAGVPASGFPDPAGSMFDNFVIVPPPGFAPPGTTSAPTGVVFNGSSTDFLLDKGTPKGKSAAFIFVTEDGTISGWNPVVNLAPGAAPPSINGVLEVDHSDNGSNKGAVYKGATSGEINGKKYLYVTNFRSARVEVYDTNFQRVHLGEDAFEDEAIPSGFAPFNIQNIGGNLFVTYAKQNPEKHDDTPGPGNGFVDIYSTTGRLEGRLQHGPWLDSPWGVVWTPRDFGEFSNTILVGNFGSGWIAAFNGFTYQFLGFMQNPDNSLVTIDGLWALTFGNGAGAGAANTLYFSAGINGENEGLFGTLTAVQTEQDGDEE
jgi:uncharacterized protein (TIGR03118 family)